jgi:hypothetical protein
MEESRIEKRLKESVHKIGGLAFKFVSPGMNGVPDRLVLLPGGKVAFVELKAKDGKLSKIQETRRKQIKKLGFEVVCLNSNDLIDMFIVDKQKTSQI